MKVLVISGFLGAGKTTFIKELANRTGRDIAIFENEYAAEGVDKAILEDGITNGDVNIWEMAQGCICCSTKGDFRESVLTIANSVDPEILIVEPTGVGMLSNVIDNVKQIEYERIKLLAPVTIVDGGSVDRYLSQYDELYVDQIKGASVIVVSKTENTSDEEKERIKEVLNGINPDAKIITDHYSNMDDAWFDALYDHYFDKEINASEADKESNITLPENFSIEGIKISSLEYLIGLLDNISRGVYGDIIRLKGHAVINGETVRFELADRMYHITGIEGEAEQSVVFIGHGIDRQGLRSKFFAKARAYDMIRKTGMKDILRRKAV